MRTLSPHLAALEIGGGRVEFRSNSTYRFEIPSGLSKYADAQVDDHRALARASLPWRPPARVSLRARASHAQPSGTLGFGFWNDPFAFSLGQGGSARKFPAAPQAVWFFYASPPSDLSLSPGSPPNGWKASCLDSPQLPGWVLGPAAAAGILASRIPGLQAPILRRALKSVRAAETCLNCDLREWHAYSFVWAPDLAEFYVDGERVLTTGFPPSGPLGFVAWIDNQYAVASPEKGFRFGIVPTEREQWLQVEGLRIERHETR